MSIVRGLYMLRPGNIPYFINLSLFNPLNRSSHCHKMWTVFVLEFAKKNVGLFSRFIPNLVGHACSLDEEINETKALQENLRTCEEFLR